MAELVGVLNTSHLLYLTDTWTGRQPEEWPRTRGHRDVRADVPSDTPEERRAQADRVIAGVRTLRNKLEELRPDVLLVVGDDHDENFGAPEIRLMPMITVFAGAEFTGRPYQHFLGPNPPHQMVPGHPALAQAILYSLVEQSFDPAFSLEVPRPEKGIGHAIMHPIGYLTDYTMPVVPIVINAVYAPCMTGKRSNELGHALRNAVEQYPADLRVVAIGSGGLWHTTTAPQSWLNEEFDQMGMKLLAAGDIKGWARHFDSYDVGNDPSNQAVELNHDSSGFPQMPGPQFGTREILDWITASSMAEGSPFTIVDMIPIYSSPIDCTFAYCDEVKQLK